jgi:hypothetical protein
MRERPRVRFWGESIVAALAGSLALLTLAWPDWIEGTFGFDPDHGNGSLEWTLVAVLFVAAGACTAVARREWRRAAPARP